MQSKRILIIDALNAFVRAYSADPSRTPQQIPVGGVRGFLKILQKMIRITAPDRIFICWDGEGGSQKRKSMFKEYKQGRKPLTLNSEISANAEDDLKNRIWQETRLVEYLNQLPIIQLMVEGVEADDLIGFIAKDPKFHTYQKVIVSNDKDFIQLCDERTILYRPVKDQILNIKTVLEEYNIHPYNFVLARAICGDISDNLPGVKGAGLATVAKRFPLLKEDKECGLDDILKICRQKYHDQKIYKAIVQEQKKIKLNHKVMQLQYRLVTAENKKKILSGIKGAECIFNKPQFNSLCLEDGLVDVDFNELFTTSEKIVLENCNDKK
jgi:5'-3' exonuclease